MIFNLMDYGHFKFRFRTIDDKDKFKRYISILIENTNNSLEYWVNSVKHVKKIQDELRLLGYKKRWKEKSSKN